jgi:hypothetical protein
MTTTKDGHCIIVLTVQCSDDYCRDGGASRTRTQAAKGADSSWDSTTHSNSLGNCEQSSSRNVSPDTGLHSSRVLKEAGHPSRHRDLPALLVDEGEDCLLLARDSNGELGWLIASFLFPAD